MSGDSRSRNSSNRRTWPSTSLRRPSRSRAGSESRSLRFQEENGVRVDLEMRVRGCRLMAKSTLTPFSSLVLLPAMGADDPAGLEDFPAAETDATERCPAGGTEPVFGVQQAPAAGATDRRMLADLQHPPQFVHRGHARLGLVQPILHETAHAAFLGGKPDVLLRRLPENEVADARGHHQRLEHARPALVPGSLALDAALAG